MTTVRRAALGKPATPVQTRPLLGPSARSRPIQLLDEDSALVHIERDGKKVGSPSAVPVGARSGSADRRTCCGFDLRRQIRVEDQAIQLRSLSEHPIEPQSRPRLVQGLIGRYNGRMHARKTVHTMWFLVQRAEDMPSVWEGHCLDVDAVAHGATVEEALDAAARSASIIIEKDICAKADPARRRAPEEYWRTLMSVIEHGERTSTDELLGMSSEDIIAALNLDVEVEFEFTVIDGGGSGKLKVPPSQKVWRKVAA